MNIENVFSLNLGFKILKWFLTTFDAGTYCTSRVADPNPDPYESILN
jgi:hypothetical protein